MNAYRRFISFEGIDYSGKTTQLQLLLKRLQSLPLDVHLLREPGGTVISEKTRDILLDKAHTEMHPETEILLYSAARAQLVNEKLLPLLSAGKYVIADRFFDSTTVYQGYGRRLDVRFVKRLNRFATAGLVPYKTFLIDIPPDVALKRFDSSNRSSDRLDVENLAFYRTIHTAYHQLVAATPGRFFVIDGTPGIDIIAAEIWEKIIDLWNL